MSGPVGPPLLAAVGIRKQFGALVVVDGVDLTVNADEAVGVVGPNGAGKTTLLDVLAGEQLPSAGSVRFGDQDVTSFAAARRCRLGIGRSHQVPKPFSGMTVFENVLVGATAGGGQRGRAAHDVSVDVLARTGLLAVANARAEALGLLARKRLELARALATAPTVLLLDEIAGGLTDEETVELVVTVQELRRQGVAIVWIEHILHVLLQVCGRLVCMSAGKIISHGDPQSVMKDPLVVEAYLGRGAV